MKFFVAFAALIAVASANPLNTWNLADLTEAVNNPHTNPSYLPYLQYALSQLLVSIANGATVDAIVVPAPVEIDVPSAPSSWTLQELSAALQNSHTDPAAIPVLQYALDSLMNALFSGQNVDTVIVNLPIGNIEIEPIPVYPVPEIPIPETPVPETPVVPTPKPPMSSPLVQVIVNINGQQQQITQVDHNIPTTPVDFVDDVSDDIPEDVLASLR